MRTLLPIALLLSFSSSACNLFLNYYEPVEKAEFFEKSAPFDPAPAPVDGKVKVMNWNIKFGGARIDFFYDCFGDRKLMKKHEVTANLDAIVAKINELDPDILLLQEVDVASDRSALVNEIQYILDRTRLNYAAYASQWRVEFIPNGLGQMDDGNAVLSRWPLGDAERIALPLSSEQPEFERQFYLKRNILRATTEIPGFGPLAILNIHADAYSKDGTKKKHIERFKLELDRAAEAGERFVAGGDLNTLPPGTEKTKGFPDSVCPPDSDFVADDYSAEGDWLDGFYADYEPVISLERYQADNSLFFSHTVDGRGFWNRMLDYLFTNLTFVPDSGTVHQDTMPLSDHAPVTGVLELQ